MARRIVDLPEPERPISTQISPCSMARLMSGGAEDGAGRGEDLVARRALVDQRERRFAVVAEDDVDVPELDRRHVHELAFRRSGRLQHAVEDDGEQDDGEAGLEAHARC